MLEPYPFSREASSLKNTGGFRRNFEENSRTRFIRIKKNLLKNLKSTLADEFLETFRD